MKNKNEIKQSENKSLVYILSAVLIILVVYIYTTKGVISKQELDSSYIKKGYVIFEDLDAKSQKEYVLKKLCDKKINQPVSVPNVKKEIVQPIVVEKVIEVEKIVKVKLKPELLDKTKYKTYTCTSLESGSIYILQKCQDDLDSFLENNKDAKIYEVIGLVDNAEFRLIKKLEDVYGKNKIGNLAKYAQIGLSRQRVIEATWIMKKQLGSIANVNTVNYTVTTKNKRGFIVRAYK